ncbi:MAG: endolytic transglycosylase MltG [Pseudomonadota bacterium]
MWKGLVSLVFLLAILAMAIGGGGWAWLQSKVSAEGPSLEQVVYTVERGDTLVGIAADLEAQGVITDARAMRIKARIDGTSGAIKAGTFEIPAGASIADVLDLMVEGDVIQHRVTIPEGLTTAQILRLLEAEPVLTGALPDEPPAEGSLLPDTYLVDAGTPRSALLERMAAAQDDVLARLWETRAPAIPIGAPEEAVILASIVEKETGKAGERALVAGLFTNRLRRGMRLQSDPTVIYGVSKGEPLMNARGQRRTLFRSELDRETPWNTYQIDGLPRTPICNPGRDAIAAVLDPPDTDYIFFVADGTGGHVFSKTLAEHNRAVADYRRFERAEIARERSGD